jgi:hypothetical protein
MGAGDPNLPVFVGDSRRLIARAIDDTARAPLDRALIGLGHRFLGTPARPVPPGAGPEERLVLDLTAVDPLSFVEQLLALVNSRQVRTRTQGVDRFSDHVRVLRYGGPVAACRRLAQPSRWAQAAERRGYLVDLSRFLPGAQTHRLPLQALGAQPVSQEGERAGARRCSLPAGSSAVVTLHTIPPSHLKGVLPSLRSGDLFVLVRRSPPLQAGSIGLVEIAVGRAGALWVQPGRGVRREIDLLRLVREQTDILGVSFLRPIPKTDG